MSVSLPLYPPVNAKLSLMCLNTQTILKGGYPIHHQNTRSFDQNDINQSETTTNRKVRSHPVLKQYINCHLLFFFLLFLVFFGFTTVFFYFFVFKLIYFCFFLVIRCFCLVLHFLFNCFWSKGLWISEL